MINRRLVILIGALACFAACSGDFLVLFILGPRFPGYNQLSDTMSYLGSSASPVSGIVSLWWVILGILVILFATGFKTAYSPGGKYVKTAFWLLVLYGLGEGLGSGLFKADRVSDSYTTSFIIHDILGGIGVFAILLLPLAVRKIKPFCSSPAFVFFSNLVLIIGILFLILFSVRFLDPGKNQIAMYTGLWQRLFVLNCYIYISAIAFRMIRKTIHKEI
jgi:hypothetical protein